MTKIFRALAIALGLFALAPAGAALTATSSTGLLTLLMNAKGGEVITLVRQEFGQRGLPLLEGLGENHLAHRVDAVAFEEHVLRARQSDADGAERHGVGRLLRRIGVRPHRHPRRSGRPSL